MLGSAPLEAVLGSGIDNRDHDAVRAFIRQAADLGLNILFIYPGTKLPADLRTGRQKTADDKKARAEAQAAGRRDWATVRSPAGLALATSDKAVLDRYLKVYIETFSTWERDTDNGPTGERVSYTKKLFDAGEIIMTEPAAVNLAVEVGGSGVVVVDCDTAAQTRRWFEVAMGADFNLDPTTWPAPTILTPGHIGESGNPDDPGSWAHSDGGHFWFTVPDKLIPTLPRHIGAMTWGGDNGFAVLWDRRYVLIPPSTRPEGAYEQLGHVYELPPWLAEEIQKAGERRIQRAALAGGARTENTELATAVDAWAETVSWVTILEPMGWTPAPRADACGCPVWTAPGEHASYKSATAHDTGCTTGRYTETNAPLHLWTDHDAPPFTDRMSEPGWTPTFSKLQAVALINYGGNIGKAMDALDVTPDLSVDPDTVPKTRGTDADLDTSGDGSFEMPTGDLDPVVAAIKRDRDYLTDQQINGHSSAPEEVASGEQHRAANDPHDDQGNRLTPADDRLWCSVCQTAEGEFHAVEDDHQITEVWHRLDSDDNEGHRAELEWWNAQGGLPQNKHADPRPVSTDPGDLPADFLQQPKAESPYPDAVDDPDPDVFDSPHNGVPRIAPFSHWRDLPPPEYIIDGLIEHGGLSCIIGPPGVGKSTVALDMACHIATGKRWQGRQTLKTRVLYLPGEGLSGAVQRIKAWEAAHEIDLDDNLLLGNGIILVNAQNEAWGDIAGYIARQGIGLVIFDTFARMSAGLEENSATDVGRAVRRFDKLKELTNAGVLVVHHTGKGSPDVARGSSALNGALDSELLVRLATWDTTQIADANGHIEGKPIELWTSKQKNAEQLEHPIPLLMTSYTLPGAERSTALITGPNGNVDPMQGEVVLARPLPEPVVETAIRIRMVIDRLTQQGATRSDIMLSVRPDAYARSRDDTPAYWKQRIGEAVDRGLRYQLIETLTGTPSGSRYIPSTASPDQARALAAAEITDSD